jgi:hypothetical protein
MPAHAGIQLSPLRRRECNNLDSNFPAGKNIADRFVRDLLARRFSRRQNGANLPSPLMPAHAGIQIVQ